MQKKSNILKYALFATGLSGIVAEYILSTLATYFLGDSILQWTLILSFMLFSMGVGSSLSRFIKTDLIDKFIFIEFLLSVLTAFSTSIAYTFSVYTEIRGIIIYSLAILIGILIGLEIPLVTRINEQFEELRVNIANVLEKDYYGSLIGGLFFAFVGLPFLGLTYTPFVLGMINFIVAVMLYIKLKPLFRVSSRIILSTAVLVLVLIGSGAVFAQQIILFGEQAKYSDKIVYSEQSRYQKLVVTQWNDFYWFYINGNQQLSTFDEWLYHEPLVHPASVLTSELKDVLILGGGDGCAAREILKHYNPESVTVVDLDPSVTRLARENEIFRNLNKDSMRDPRVKIVNADAFNFLESSSEKYDLIISDLPDPKSADLSRLYSREFFNLCRDNLKINGILVTQASSPLYSPLAFECINKTMRASGFGTLKLHNNIPTMGEWGWIAGSVNRSENIMRKYLLGYDFEGKNFRFLNNSAVRMMINSGKLMKDTTGLKVNTLTDPVLVKYYDDKFWEVY